MGVCIRRMSHDFTGSAFRLGDPTTATIASRYVDFTYTDEDVLAPLEPLPGR